MENEEGEIRSVDEAWTKPYIFFRSMLEVSSVRYINISGHKRGHLYGEIIFDPKFCDHGLIYHRSREHPESVHADDTVLLTGPDVAIDTWNSFFFDVALTGSVGVVAPPMFENAVPATVEVSFIKGDEEYPTELCGNITARNSDFMPESFHSVLFRKTSWDEDEDVDVRPGQPIPLSKSSMAVNISGKYARELGRRELNYLVREVRRKKDEKPRSITSSS
ncbi:hypothetical protein L1049_022914 [Liquidambar formosana]|uniref:DUF6598 domain-containing protein n=1 Tax=Liquidambar formosana TaxID=63359 RepID=A0AAP0WPB1_LIQFO